MICRTYCSRPRLCRTYLSPLVTTCPKLCNTYLHSTKSTRSMTTPAMKNDSVPTGGLNSTQRYIFDTSGYIVLRDVFTKHEVDAANAAIDAHSETLHERTGNLRCSTLYGRESSQLAGDGKTGRFDMGGMLGWSQPHCDPFREVLAHPRLVSVLNELAGVGYRLDHSPLLLVMEEGSEGHTLHGGAVTESGEPAWNILYECKNQRIRNQLLTVCMQLSDTQPGDGGFCIVPGSHKSNFPVPPTLADFSQDTEVVVQPCPNAGDVLIFTEAALHGTLPWASKTQRRTVIYRFAPPNMAYGRGYQPNWPEAYVAGMTAEQRAVMEPPYNIRMNRPSLVVKPAPQDAGTTATATAESSENPTTTAVELLLPKPREAFKVEFDEKVFGSRYY